MSCGFFFALFLQRIYNQSETKLFIYFHCSDLLSAIQTISPIGKVTFTIRRTLLIWTDFQSQVINFWSDLLYFVDHSNLNWIYAFSMLFLFVQLFYQSCSLFFTNFNLTIFFKNYIILS